MTDPWLVRENKNCNQESLQESSSDKICEESDIKNSETSSLEFEDNFLPTHKGHKSSTLENYEHTRLPDSEDYLQALEKKLRKIKKNPKILEALAEKRAECLRNLLIDNVFVNKDESLKLDAPIPSSDSAVQGLYRHIQPVQPLSIGETVHIVKYDQLEPELDENDLQGQEDSTSESTSRFPIPHGLGLEESYDHPSFGHHSVPHHGHTFANRNQYSIGTVELAELDDDSVEEYTTDSDDDDDTEEDDDDEEEGENDILADLGRSH